MELQLAPFYAKVPQNDDKNRNITFIGDSMLKYMKSHKMKKGSSDINYF